MGPYRIPFNHPAAVGREHEYIVDAIKRGHISGDGEYSRRAHNLLEDLVGTPKALLTTSCTHALEMSALLLEIETGDEVIVPSFTFVSVANAFALRGAKIVFCDIRPDTLNMDERQLPDLITDLTKAIVPVHYAGVGCEMDEILKIANDRGIAVVEDNAHGLFGTYKRRQLGTFGTLAAQSFHETKNFTCGEGGALLVNDESLIEQAEIIREKGTDRSRFFRGQVDKYTWRDIGSSYLPSDILAAFLFGQLEQREVVQEARQRVWTYYENRLKEWATENAVTTPYVPAWCEQSYHMYYLLMPSLRDRQGLIAHLKSRGMLAVFHYLPLHLSAMGRRFGGRSQNFPVTERVSDCLLRLPFYTTLSEPEQAEVVEAILDFSTHLL